jgi:hypothetical protein
VVALNPTGKKSGPAVNIPANALPPGLYTVSVDIYELDGSGNRPVDPVKNPPVPLAFQLVDIIERTRVTLDAHVVGSTSDQSLWTVIRSSTGALSFDNYKPFIDSILGGKKLEDVDKETGGTVGADLLRSRSLPFPGVETYKLLKIATEVFMTLNSGVDITDADSGLFDSVKLSEESARYSRDSIQKSELEQLWTEYLTPASKGESTTTLPYLALIRQKLGDVPIRSNGAPNDHFNWIIQDKLTGCWFNR